MKTLIIHLLAVAALALPVLTSAGPHDKKVRDLLGSDVSAWINDPVVINTIKRQNSRHAALTAGEIDKLDKQWRRERKSNERPLIDRVLNNKLSLFLKNVADNSNGLYAEIFVMDNKGLNVGQNNLTSDYWQGDEDKWQKTYLAGPDSVYIDAIEYDESAKRFQIQVSAPIVDPATKTNIGAVTIGLAMRKLALREAK